MAKRNPHKSAYATRRPHVVNPGSPDDLAAREAAALFKPGVTPDECGPGSPHRVIRMLIVARSKAERQVAAMLVYRGLRVPNAARELGMTEGRCREVYESLIQRLRQAEDRLHREEILAKNGV